MDQLSPLQLLGEVMSATGLADLVGGPEQLAIGLQQMQVELLRVGLDVQLAEARGIRLAVAVRDFHNFPALARVHVAVEDMLRWSMPPGVATWARRMLEGPEPPFVDEVRRLLGEVAAHDANPTRRAIGEWAMFEGVRMNLMVRAYLNPDETLGVTGDDLSEIAEEKVRQWLKPPAVSLDGIRPLHIIVGAALASLRDFADDLRKALMLVQTDFRAAIERQARLERKIGELDAGDAVLVRNELAEQFGEARLSVELLQKRHPYALDASNRNNVDQKLSRTRMKLLDGGMPAVRRKRSALLDIIEEVEGRIARRKG